MYKYNDIRIEATPLGKTSKLPHLNCSRKPQSIHTLPPLIVTSIYIYVYTYFDKYTCYIILYNKEQYSFLPIRI